MRPSLLRYPTIFPRKLSDGWDQPPRTADCAHCAGCLCSFQSRFLAFISIGPIMRQSATKSFRNSAIKTCAIAACQNLPCAAGSSTAAENWKTRWRFTVVIQAAILRANIRWTRRWPTSLAQTVAIPDLSARSLGFKAAPCPRRWKSWKARALRSRATATCGSQSIATYNKRRSIS